MKILIYVRGRVSAWFFAPSLRTSAPRQKFLDSRSIFQNRQFACRDMNLDLQSVYVFMPRCTSTATSVVIYVSYVELTSIVRKRNISEGVRCILAPFRLR